MKEVCRNNSTSDDDDEDRKTLIMQNQIKSNSNSSFAIEIDELSPPIRRRFNKKRYLIAILIPLIVVLVYFSVDFRNLFKNSSVWDVGLISSSSDQMRESELKALNLLQQQQEELIKLLNRVGSKNYVSNLSNSSDLEATRAQVYKQISLNKEIQKVILSKSRNLSELGIENGDLMYEGIKMCPKIDQKFGERRTIEWNPRSDKFLFAVCISGQMSNHLICLEKHMFFAAVLGRVLVIPNQRVDYDYSKVLDIEHINKCIGRKVVITFDEFYEMKKKDLRINRFICYFSQPQKCYMDDDHVDKLKTLGMSLPDLESPWVEDVKNPKKRTVQDVEGKFSSDDDVIAIGDVFFAVVDRDWVMQPRGPIAHKCSTLIEPSRLIMLSTQRFIQTFLGKHYAALHFRRHGWLKFCNAKNPSCFYSVPQSADCIRRVVEKANAPVIYLSTDAADSETGLLQSLIIVDGKPIPLVKRPSRNSAEKWDALLYRHGLDDDPQVEAMLDKTICAMSSVFIGSSGSTFTEDIMRLRKGWGSASICDEYLCQGELPNFIAEDE